MIIMNTIAKKINLKKYFSSFFRFLYAIRSVLTIQDYFRIQEISLFIFKENSRLFQNTRNL